VGVALLPRFLVEQQLQERKLVLLFDLPLYTESAYYVVLPESTPRKIANDFADWATERLRPATTTPAA
jgi:LysR family glycine cleavage system transcriptional activator